MCVCVCVHRYIRICIKEIASLPRGEEGRRGERRDDKEDKWVSGRERESQIGRASELIDESSGREAKRARENRYRRHVLLIVATIECTPRNFKLPRAYRRHRCRAVCGSYAPRLFRAIRFLHFSLSHLLFFRFADAVPGRCIYPLAYQSARRQGKISKLVYVALFLLTLFSLLPLSLSLPSLALASRHVEKSEYRES